MCGRRLHEVVVCGESNAQMATTKWRSPIRHHIAEVCGDSVSAPLRLGTCRHLGGAVQNHEQTAGTWYMRWRWRSLVASDPVMCLRLCNHWPASVRSCEETSGSLLRGSAPERMGGERAWEGFQSRVYRCASRSCAQEWTLPWHTKHPRKTETERQHALWPSCMKSLASHNPRMLQGFTRSTRLTATALL